MKKTPLVGGQERWEFPELKEFVISELGRLGTVVVDKDDLISIEVTIVSRDNYPFCVHREYEKNKLKVYIDGVLVWKDSLEVVDKRIPRIRFLEAPVHGTNRLRMKIWLEKIQPHDEPYHAQKRYLENFFRKFVLGLRRDIYYL